MTCTVLSLAQRRVCISFVVVLLWAGHGEAAPILRVTPTAIGFGDVPLDQTVQLSTTITNTTANNLTGWAGGGVAAPFGASQDCNIPGGLPPGASCHYYFTFTPTAAGAAAATSTSTVQSGGDTLTITVSLSGTGVATPVALVTPTIIGFGNVPVGETVQLATTITNTSTHNLTGWAGGGVGAPFGASQDCNIPGGLPPGASCHYYFSFTPTAPGAASATSMSTAQSGSQTLHINVSLSGTGVPIGPLATTTELVSSVNPSMAGQEVIFTATVHNGWSAPTGTVTFRDGVTPLGPPANMTNGVASFSTSALAPGTHAITAVYSGDNDNDPSTSPELTQVVVAPPAITKSFGAPTVLVRADVSLHLAVHNPNATVALTGVGFTDALPAGLRVLDGSRALCGGTLTTTSTTGVIALSGATVAAGGDCTVEVTVTGREVGTWNNTTTGATSAEGGTGDPSNTASIDVIAPDPIPALGGPGLALLLVIVAGLGALLLRRQG